MRAAHHQGSWGVVPSNGNAPEPGPPTPDWRRREKALADRKVPVTHNKTRLHVRGDGSSWRHRAHVVVKGGVAGASPEIPLAPSEALAGAAELFWASAACNGSSSSGAAARRVARTEDTIEAASKALEPPMPRKE